MPSTSATLREGLFTFENLSLKSPTRQVVQKGHRFNHLTEAGKALNPVTASQYPFGSRSSHRSGGDRWPLRSPQDGNILGNTPAAPHFYPYCSRAALLMGWRQHRQRSG
tara:strand:+ start:1384 stop:1710 length:327 start_codon:yes stop_codon:yes gene_type:complete